jgi:adenosylmethionine-8-amino-7-oxononanoate aminotransferase
MDATNAMNHESLARLRAMDARHLWHPYTDIPRHEREGAPVIARAEGIYLYTADGRRLIDGISSWWCVALGHGRPEIVEAIRRQAGILTHSILGGLTHEPAIELAARLAALCPGDLSHVHFASDGASAVECALKIALQYWHNLGRPRRKKFACLESAYHGDTLGAVGVGYIPAFHVPFQGAVIPGLRAKSPYDPLTPLGRGLASCAPGSLASMERLVEKNAEDLAAVIVEPVIQGAAGAWIYPPEYVGWLRALCDRHGLLLIADEIAVGLGRTGRRLACDHAVVAPDILCLGKALTGGTLPLSAAIATGKVYDAFRSIPGQDRMLYHGHTFCGNPPACAAALAMLDVFERERVIERSEPVARRMAEGLAALCEKYRPVFRQWRAIGMVGVLELDPATGGGAASPQTAAINGAAAMGEAIKREALARGLFLRPLAGSVYLWPPLTTTLEEMNDILGILDDAIGAATSQIKAAR